MNGTLPLAFSGSRQHPPSHDRRRERGQPGGADPQARHPADKNRRHHRLRLRLLPHAKVRPQRHRDLHRERRKSTFREY